MTKTFGDINYFTVGLIIPNDLFNAFNTLQGHTQELDCFTLIAEPKPSSLLATFPYKDSLVIATITVPIFNESAEQLDVLKVAPGLLLEDGGHLSHLFLGERHPEGEGWDNSPNR